MPNLPDNVIRFPARRRIDTLTALQEALGDVVRLADDLAEQGDWQSLGVGLAQLRVFRRAVADVERHVEDHTAELMPHDHVDIDGLVLERRMSKVRRAWQSEELLRRLVGDQLVNPETGENVYRTLVECVPFTGSLGWRTGALRKHGISPDEWCDETPGRATVRAELGEGDE